MNMQTYMKGGFKYLFVFSKNKCIKRLHLYGLEENRMEKKNIDPVSREKERQRILNKTSNGKLNRSGIVEGGRAEAGRHTTINFSRWMMLP